MALNSGALPKGTETSIAKTDFNAAMTQLDGAFPLAAVDLGTNAVEETKIKNGSVTKDKLASASVSPVKIEAIDSPADGEVPTYNLAQTKFEWKPAGGGTPVGLFVPRRISVDDFREDAFIRDSTWKINGLDISGIVPAGAIAVKLMIMGITASPGDVYWLRTNDTDALNNWAFLQGRTDTYNYDVGQFDLPIDADRKLDYKISASYSTIHLNVVGWYI